MRRVIVVDDDIDFRHWLCTLLDSSKDTRGWRLFTEENLEEIRAKANKVEIEKESSTVSGSSQRPGRKRLKQ